MIFEVVIVLIIIVIAPIIINGVQNYNKKKVKMSFKESMNLTELPVITFYNESTKLNFC